MSFFESLLEGTANAAATSLGSYQKRQQLLEDDERNQKQAIDRADTIERNRLKLAEEQRQELAKRKMEQLQQAENGGAALGKSQALAALRTTYGKDVPEEDLLPQEIDAFTDKSPLTEIDNQRKYAQSNGLFDAASDLKVSYDETVKAMAAKYERDFKARQEDRKDAKDANQHKEAMARIDADSGRRSKAESDQSFDRLTSRKQAALRAIGTYQTQGMSADDPQMKAEMQELADVNAMLSQQRSSKPKQEPGKEEPKKLPAAAAGWKILKVK